MGLRHGAKQLIEKYEALENRGFELMTLARQRVKYNPNFSIDKLLEAEDCFRAARKIRDEELPAMLQKAAPPLEKQVDELRRLLEDTRGRLDALEQPSNVVRMRKAE